MLFDKNRFIAAINKQAKEYFFTLGASTEDCMRQLSEPGLSFYQILVLTFACKTSDQVSVFEPMNEMVVGSTEIIVSVMAKAVQAMTKFFAAHGFTGSYIGTQIAQYIATFNMSTVYVGPWFKFWIAFCSDQFKSILGKMFEGFKMFMRSVGSVAANLVEMSTIISSAIYGVFSSAGAIPPGLSEETFKKLFTQELQNWHQRPSLDGPLTPFGKLCKTLTSIADWRYSYAGTELNPGETAEELMADVWDKVLEALAGGANTAIDIISEVGTVLQSLSNWIANNPGQAITIGVCIAIGIAIVAASGGTAAPKVAYAIVLIAGAMGISLEGMSEQQIQQSISQGI